MMLVAEARRTKRPARTTHASRFRRLTVPETLETRATPGGSVAELVFGPLASLLLGSAWADGTPLGSDELPGQSTRRQDRLTALTELRQDNVAFDSVLGELRRLTDIVSADRAVTESYVGTARQRVEKVADTLMAGDSATLGSQDFLEDLRWVDELFASMAQAKTLGASGLSSEFAMEGDSVDGVGTLDYGGDPPPNYPPVANDDGYQTKHDSTRTVSQSEGVLVNDYDPNYGTVLTASLVSGPSHAASFTFNSNGSFTYTPAYHFVGTDTFVYRASDGSLTDDAQVTITVFNVTPTATNNGYETKHDSTRTVGQSEGVLANDISGDGDPITATLVSGPSHAQSFTLNADGSFSYTPAYHFVGTDSFTYSATDGIASSTPATVSISVFNLAPTVQNDSYTTKHDTQLVVAAPGVKSNDSSPDGDPTTAILVSGPAHAATNGFHFNADGSFDYTPAYHYVGTDSFTYKLNDGITDSATATVTINVFNNVPVANADGSYMTLRDIPLKVNAPGVLANDTDIDGDTRTAASWTGPSHGALDLRVDGEFTYTPSGGYVGTDSFQYKAYDGIAYSVQPATVSLAVANMRLYSVSYQQDNNVLADPGVTAYGAIEWVDANQDGDADDPGDSKFPTSYVRGETLSVSASFRLDRAWQGGTILVCATGPDGITVPWTAASVNGTTVTVSGVQAQGAFPNSVKHYDDFQLNWFATVQGQTAYTQVGTSLNDLYLTLAEPQGPMYHTVVHLGSHNAQGATSENDVILDVWNNVFSTNSVQRVDGIPLWYYHSYLTMNTGTQGLLTPIATTDGTLGDGQCGAWASFMLDVIGTQGVRRPNSYVLVQPSVAEGFLVNFWQFGGATANAAIERNPGDPINADIAAYPYLNVEQVGGDIYNAAGNGYTFRYTDVTDGVGTQGKGPNSNPASVFGNHQFCQFDFGFDPMWFDPSYGAIYEGASREARELDFDDSGIAGYYIERTARVREWVVGVDLNGVNGTNDVVEVPVMLIKANSIGVREVSATIS
jgi:hypothetical protein